MSEVVCKTYEEFVQAQKLHDARKRFYANFSRRADHRTSSVDVSYEVPGTMDYGTWYSFPKIVAHLVYQHTDRVPTLDQHDQLKQATEMAARAQEWEDAMYPKPVAGWNCQYCGAPPPNNRLGECC